MHANPFAEFEDRRSDLPGSVPGTGIGRQVGWVPAHAGPAGRGWSLAYVGADRFFVALALMVILVGLVVWLVASVLS